MLKLELDTIEGLEDGVKGLYEEKDGKFRLKVDGLPDVSGLKKKLDELMDESKAAKRKAKEIEEAAERERAEALAKSGDVESLRKSYDEKFGKTKIEYETQIQNYQQQLQRLTVGQTATTLAAELAIPGSAPVLLPHIQARLSMEIRDGQPVTVVMSADGKPSAMTIEELKTELSANPAFAPIIAASKAAGGGASGGGNGGGAAKKAVTRAQFDSMNAVQRTEHLKAGGTITN
jgi:hypothetical protein